MSLSQWWHHCRTHIDPWQENTASLLDTAQELELWVQCIRETRASETLLRPRSAARLARDAWHNLLAWQIDWRTGAVAAQFSYNLDAELFVQWATRFEQLCEETQLSVPDTQIMGLANSCRQHTLVLLEFDELPPLQRSALNQQAQQLIEHSESGPSAHRIIHSCENREQELYAAARWAKQVLESQADARIGVLLEDVASQRLRFERILRDTLQPELDREAGLPVNFSAGVALSTTPLVSTALSLLELISGDTGVEELSTVLHSRYRYTTERTAEAQMLQKLYRNGRADIGRNNLHWFTRDLALGKTLLEFSQHQQLSRQHYACAWSHLFSKCLTQLGWPGTTALNSSEYQMMEHWQSCLDKFAGLERVSGALDFESALGLLRQVCTDTVFQIQTRDTQLQVLGLLEATGMQFDYLWIIGTGQNDWPATPNPNPFIPIRLQRDAGMPHADSQREREFAQRMLQRFSHACVELHASYASLTDGIEQGPSTLFDGFRQCDETGPTESMQRWIQRSANVATDRVEFPAPPVNSEELETLRGGSSLIQDQSLCGFRAFVQQRLQVRALPELSHSLTAADRGNLLHTALNNLWGHFPNQSALKARESEWQQSIDQAVEAALAEFRGSIDQTDALILTLEKKRLQQLLVKWLEVESQREEFSVLAREQEQILELGPLRLRLRIDRVDRLENGELLIIDYKSAAAEIRYWMGDRPTQPQLPLYAHTLKKDCAGISFALVRTDEPGFLGLAKSEAVDGISTNIAKASSGAAESWDGMQSHWQRVLEALAQAFLDGSAAVDPPDINSSCSYCGLQSVCRIAERGYDGNA